MQIQKRTVAKFGGTSMASEEAMKKSAKIVCERKDIVLVIVSATSGTTQKLLQIYNSAVAGNRDEVQKFLDEIETRHRQIRNHSAQLDELYIEMRTITETIEIQCSREKKGELKPGKRTSLSCLLDQLFSIGERLSSLLFTEILNEVLSENEPESKRLSLCFDVRSVLRTSSSFGKAEPETQKIRLLAEGHLIPLLHPNQVLVTQGFIGSTESGETTTLGRGASDFSAALLAEAIGAQELQIWTDVPGIFTTDPSVVPEARSIPLISFDEAAELANFGAKVLHPVTLQPAIRSQLRVFVGSTFEPQLSGTWIGPDSSGFLPTVRAIALRKNQTLITATSLEMVNAHGFLARLFTILAAHQLSVDLVTTSEVSVSLTIDETNRSSSGKAIRENTQLLDELKSFCEIQIEDHLSLIALIGNRLTRTHGISARAFTAIQNTNIRLICHGASSHNLCFLVGEEDAKGVLKKLHREFIEEKEISPPLRAADLTKSELPCYNGGQNVETSC